MEHQLSRKAEADGKKWLTGMLALLQTGNYDEFFKRLHCYNNSYLVVFEILGCIGQLTDGVAIDSVFVSPKVINNIALTNDKPRGYRIDYINGRIGVIVLSDSDDFAYINDGVPNQQRQGNCHEKAFEIFKRSGINTRLVTALVSILSEKHTYLHSWVEDDDTDCVYDYTLNVAMNIHTYKVLMQAQAPLLSIAKRDVANGGIYYDDWMKMIERLYI